MARTRTRSKTTYDKPTYTLGRHCVLCNAALEDDHPNDWCCGRYINDRRLLKLAVDARPIVVTFVRSRVLAAGTTRRRYGHTNAGDPIIWDEIA